MKHGMTRLDNVWGVGGGLRPVTSLVRSMGLLLQEYASSDDTVEAARCLKELEVPHFHHELVYEAIVLALEASNEETENSMVKLLKSFCDSTIITPDQMKNVSCLFELIQLIISQLWLTLQGIYRVLDDLDDICLDVPNAATYLERMGLKCKTAGLIDEAMMQKIPARGRKRFVSEGDGGRFKD